MTSKRDVERRLSDLEGDRDGDGPTDKDIQEAMWSALVEYHTEE